MLLPLKEPLVFRMVKVKLIQSKKWRSPLTCHVHIIHLLDSAEPDIRFVVQIEAHVGQSEAESNIALICTTNRLLGEVLSNKCFIMPKLLNDDIES